MLLDVLESKKKSRHLYIHVLYNLPNHITRSPVEVLLRGQVNNLCAFNNMKKRELNKSTMIKCIYIKCIYIRACIKKFYSFRPYNSKLYAYKLCRVVEKTKYYFTDRVNLSGCEINVWTKGSLWIILFHFFFQVFIILRGQNR